MTKYFLPILLAIAVSSCGVVQRVPSTAINSSLLWEVTGNGARDTSYLFGTFHALKSGFVDTLKPVMSRFSRSTAVVGEILLTDPSSMLGIAGSMKSAVPLKKLLSEADYRKTDSIFKWTTGYGVGFYNTMKPMAAQSQLVKSLFDKIYPTNSHPDEEILDMHFQNKGLRDQKKVLALETIEEQMKLLFNDITIERQAEMLLDMIRDFDSSKLVLTMLADCYVNSDMDCLERIGNESEGFTEAEMEAMVTTRNSNWMKQLPQIFKEHRAFVAVGALHLPGEHGVVNLLRKAGYTVKPIPIH
jgi:uncharacterized protein YbaP (TraB family)